MKKIIFVRILLLFLISSANYNLALAESYSSAQDLTLSSQSVSTAAAGRDIVLSNVTVEGKLSAGRNIDCKGCTVAGSVSAGRDVSLEQCETVYSIASGRDTNLSQTKVASHISSGHNVQMSDVIVEKGLSAGNEVEADNSTINGLLSLGGHYLKLNKTTTDDIHFNDHANFNSSGNTIQVNTHVRGNVTINQGHTSLVKIGTSGLSSVNGYTIKGTADQTIIITPDQTIYVNGKKVSGNGPKTYEQYMTEHPGAPTVHGPGWSSDQPDSPQKAEGNKPTDKTPVNILDLMNNSVINGQVIFESGYGKIRVYPGSEFKGKVVNGTIEKVEAQAAQ
jgi:hypothetical protein